VYVHIQDAGDLKREFTPAGFRDAEPSAKLRPFMNEVIDRMPQQRFAGIAFGTEFCENLLPSRAATEAVVESARANALPVLYYTPYCSDTGIESLRPLLACLPPGSEVAFSDWGVLNVLRREFPLLRPVQGRLLHKGLRDPRITGLYSIEGVHNATLDALRQSNVGSASYAAFLKRMGIVTVELENLIQGVDLSAVVQGIEVAVPFPYGFVSTSRICQAAALHYRKVEKFQPGSPCRHECQTHLLEYTYSTSPFPNTSQQFWLKGNTYFFTHTLQMVDSLLALPNLRLIFQPRLPMVAS